MAAVETELRALDDLAGVTGGLWQGLETRREWLEAALAFQEDLDRIRSKVTEMGDLAEKSIRASIKAVVEKDRQLAFVVILRDQYIDEMEKQLDKLCLDHIARFKRPKAYAFLAELPKNNAGKVLKTLLRERVKDAG